MVERVTGQQQEQPLLGNVFTLERAGDLLGGVPASTLRGWILAGRLDALRAGRRWLVTRRSLERFLRENQ